MSSVIMLKYYFIGHSALCANVLLLTIVIFLGGGIFKLEPTVAG